MHEKRDVWGFYESIHGPGWTDDPERRKSLSDIEREVAAICDLRQEVNSGGFDVYFRYWGGDTALVALSAFDNVLGPEWSAILAEAMAALGPSYSLDVDDRELMLDADGVYELLDAIDRRYYDLEVATEADSLLTAYLASDEHSTHRVTEPVRPTEAEPVRRWFRFRRA